MVEIAGATLGMQRAAADEQEERKKYPQSLTHMRPHGLKNLVRQPPPCGQATTHPSDS